MSVPSFLSTVQPYAAAEAAATGLDCRMFMTQWAFESGWGTSALAQHNNLAGITCAPCSYGGYCLPGTRFCGYPSLSAFQQAYNAFLHNGNYGAVLAAAGQPLLTQFVVLGQSPWDAGHYMGNCGSPGCSLIEVYQGLQSAIDAAGAACAVAPPSPPPPAPPPQPTQEPIQQPLGSSGGGSAAVDAVIAGTAAAAAVLLWVKRDALRSRFASQGVADDRPFGVA